MKYGNLGHKYKKISLFDTKLIDLILIVGGFALEDDFL